jgi:hypothetical protein
VLGFTQHARRYADPGTYLGAVAVVEELVLRRSR